MAVELVQLSVAAFPYMEDSERNRRVGVLTYRLKKLENNGNIDEEPEAGAFEKLRRLGIIRKK